MNLDSLAARQNVDPNGALMEALDQLAMLITINAGCGPGKPTPWRLGPSGQLGLPIALVSRAAGLNVTAFHEATNHLSAGALFDGRQGLHERLICGSLSDEPSISIWEIPQLLAGPIAPETSPSIASIRVAAKNAAELLVRLLDTPATT